MTLDGPTSRVHYQSGSLVSRTDIHFHRDYLLTDPRESNGSTVKVGYLCP